MTAHEKEKLTELIAFLMKGRDMAMGLPSPCREGSEAIKDRLTGTIADYIRFRDGEENQ